MKTYRTLMTLLCPWMTLTCDPASSLNILSGSVREPQGRIAQRIEVVGEDAVCTSVVVACEMRYGARKRRSLRLVEHVDAILSAIQVLAFATPADAYYGRISNELVLAGTPIGPHDMLIAAHAFARGLVVVTANDRELSRVQGLQVENWLH